MCLRANSQMYESVMNDKYGVTSICGKTQSVYLILLEKQSYYLERNTLESLPRITLKDILQLV